MARTKPISLTSKERIDFMQEVALEVTVGVLWGIAVMVVTVEDIFYSMGEHDGDV